MIQEIIKKLISSYNLTLSEASSVMDFIMEGEATPAQIACFLTALRMKGETIDEITGFASSLRKHALRVEINTPHLVDTCGTGGDGSGTFNISTAAGLVAAGAGVKVVKHGNRSVSSRCGSADVLEVLGIDINLGPEEVKKCVEEIGFGFMFAPLFHKAMKHVAPVRKELGIRTVFNILGPLASPAGATAQVLGVFSPELTEVMAQVLKNLGVRQALVVHGEDGLDEISTVAPTRVSRLSPDGRIETFILDCGALNLPRAASRDLLGADAATNAQILRSIFSGQLKGPKRDVVVLNAAAAIVVSGEATDLKEGLKMAGEAIDSGVAASKLEKLVKFSTGANQKKNA
jgi:anthranilate phosphoribosyltransferase